jgi:hypothetical protein
MLSPQATARLVELLEPVVEKHGIGESEKIIGGGDGTLYRVLHINKTITLDLADRLVTRLLGSETWHTDPVLREWYWNPHSSATPTSRYMCTKFTCKACGCDLEARTPRCVTCRYRHKTRARRARRLERAA